VDKQLLWIVEPSTSSARSVSSDCYWLDAWEPSVPEQVGVLRVYAFPGEVVALGRYHRAPPGVANATSSWHRRLGGGRVAPFGDGFVGVSLILTQRGALVGADASTLRAEQVLNRCVRGLLEGCRGAGLPVIYPGRDFVTIGRRPFAMISMEESARGFVLIEMILAVGRSFAVLPRLLDRLDPSGIVPVEMLEPDAVTSLSDELHTSLSIEQVADLVRRGFETQFGVECVATPPAVAESDAAAAGGESGSLARRPRPWLTARMPRPELDLYAVARTQLGAFEVYVALDGERRIADIQLAGDFIANSSAVARLEAALRGCPAHPEAIDAVVTASVQTPADFLLGIGPPRAITELILRATGAR